ncbi:MAG: UDP-N-acetylmuramoyl-L-alanyl-D-glutamate--2,6-diaminopimelate ligase [Bacteroidales bacterium]|nr:UDP-N-acetylmuramoyl-L-alanyl-D-glutamate--2,6-diaminopimelate ligase [Bacteroidales bacterium]
MELEKLIKDIETESFTGDRGAEIKDICFDSRKCTPGSLFVAVDGNLSDGHKYIAKAVENGASAVVYQNPEYDGKIEGAAAARVADSRGALALMASAFYGNPSSKLTLVGVTGTNGKTTTATLLYELFTQLGYHCGLLSTIANYIGRRQLAADHTTPDPVELNGLLAEMVDSGCQYCFMEVSSHSIDQERIKGLVFAGGIFSNITHDHLDYHKTFDNYLRCKKRFFDDLPAGAFALTNIDDRNGTVMVQNTSARVYTYSCGSMADFRCRIMDQTMEGMLLKMDGTQLWTMFIGAHNAHNLLAVYGTAMLLGADKEEVLTIMSKLRAVNGRLEYLRGGNNVTAVVDYAHTPDALENVLKTLRETAKGEFLICVFGCGGDRDRTKRPEMGAIAGKYADRVVVTSDNPRHEDPLAIMEDIKAGMDAKTRAKSVFIADRREAIRSAIMFAPEGGVVLVAGKGHEDYLIVGDVKMHFDDKEVIAQVFDELKP